MMRLAAEYGHFVYSFPKNRSIRYKNGIISVVCLSVYLSIYLYTYLSIYLSIYLPTYLPIYLIQSNLLYQSTIFFKTVLISNGMSSPLSFPHLALDRYFMALLRFAVFLFLFHQSTRQLNAA
jgi:hypothetical protein